jgi:Chromo (CHRromatin Organisation MOdifier) domain
MVERIKSNFVPFKKGQMVWLDSKHLKTNYHKKMAPKQEGPFKIEEVLGLGYEYLVKWAGYPITEASWEPKSNLSDATEVLQEYQERHQL